jgi:hypothetical protein
LGRYAHCRNPLVALAEEMPDRSLQRHGAVCDLSNQAVRGQSPTMQARNNDNINTKGSNGYLIAILA